MVAAGEPLRGAAGARASADRLIFKLKSRLVAADCKALAFEYALLHLFGDAKVAERVACILPALTSLLAGERPEALDILRRNVALHSEGPCGVSLVSVGHAELRKAQKHARRLEARRADTQPAAHVLSQGSPPLEAESGLRRDAAPFVPNSGCWVPLDGCGRLCTCGATCYSSCSPLPLSVEEVFEDHGDEDTPCGEAAAAEFPTRGVPPALVDGSEGVSGAAGPPQGAVPVSQPGSAASRRGPGWWLARAAVARVWLGPSLDEDAVPEAAGGVLRVRRVRFADAPHVFEIGSCSGLRGILRRGGAPGYLGPAWTRHANAVDLMHTIEGDSFGLRIPPTRKPLDHRARFAFGPRLVEALPPGMSVERAREIDRLIRLCGGL
ncbi:unnamed protein product [Prorocentrum cordatum]|uniref:Uncharacterized protein n=1 Tax=Prorocentrum cordatum TaxID=2364126 RepID=A0ABN9S433_9DINO|nr:unnamed protein product [Polarella glacialis]